MIFLDWMIKKSDKRWVKKKRSYKKCWTPIS